MLKCLSRESQTSIDWGQHPEEPVCSSHDLPSDLSSLCDFFLTAFDSVKSEDGNHSDLVASLMLKPDACTVQHFFFSLDLTGVIFNKQVRGSHQRLWSIKAFVFSLFLGMHCNLFKQIHFYCRVTNKLFTPFFPFFQPNKNKFISGYEDELCL